MMPLKLVILVFLLVFLLGVVEASVFVIGERGRLGQEFISLARKANLSIVNKLSAADFVVIAKHRSQAKEILREIEGQKNLTVIDLSGALKDDFDRCQYALVGAGGPGGRLFCSGDRLANPGCIAGGVIVGLKEAFDRAGISLAEITSPLNIVAMGSLSMAGRDQRGVARFANRQGSSHPHVAEIEHALPSVSVGSLVPMVSYTLERGLVITVSGTLEAQANDISDLQSVDLAEVLNTSNVLSQLRTETKSGVTSFTVNILLDNLSFPASNAVSLIQSLIGNSHAVPTSQVVQRPLNVLITAGATQEPIDDVRFITNFSSGKFGRALALQAIEDGNQVTVIAPKQFRTMAGSLPTGVEYIPYQSTADLWEQLQSVSSRQQWDLVMHTAAVSDFTPSVVEIGKIASGDHDELSLILEKNPKLIHSFRGLFGENAVLVGFKLLSRVSDDERVRVAQSQIEQCGTDVCIENDLTQISRHSHRVRIVTKEGEVIELPPGSKANVAGKIIQFLKTLRRNY